MDMKQHILTALQEEFDEWEELLASLNIQQISTPLLPSHWTIKDVIAHLMAWQQRSIARVEAALFDREPAFPEWLAGVDPDVEGTTEQTNAWIYDFYREQPWSAVHQDWRAGFRHFLESAAGIAERDLLDGEKYPWMHEYPLAVILLASYDHHQEHYEKLVQWLSEHEDPPQTGCAGGAPQSWESS